MLRNVKRLPRIPPSPLLNAFESDLVEWIASHSKVWCLQGHPDLGRALRCRSGSNVSLDFGDKCPVELLVEMFSPNVSKLVLRLRAVDDDRPSLTSS